MSLRLMFKKDVLLVVLAKAINGTSTLGLNLYAVHFLAPGDFGALTICTTMLVLLDGMIGAGLDLGVVKLQPLSQLTATGSPIEQASLGMKTLGCTLFGGALVLFARPIGLLLLHRPDARPLFIAWSCAATGLLLLRSVQLSLQLRAQYVAFACMELLNTALRILLVFALVRFGSASSGTVMAAYAIAANLALVVALLTLMRVTGLRRWWSFRGVSRVLHAAGTALLTYGFSAIVSRLDIFVLAAVLPPAQLGIYASALTLATIPEIAATYAAPAFLTRIRPYCEAGVFQVFFRRLQLVLLLCACGSYGVTLWLLPQLGPHLLPGRYLPAVPVTLVLLLGTLATMSIFPLSLNLLMLRNSKIFLIYDLSMFLPLTIGYIVACRSGAIAAAWVTTAFRIVKTLVIQVRASHEAARAQDDWRITQDQVVQSAALVEALE